MYMQYLDGSLIIALAVGIKCPFGIKIALFIV